MHIYTIKCIKIHILTCDMHKNVTVRPAPFVKPHFMAELLPKISIQETFIWHPWQSCAMIYSKH